MNAMHDTQSSLLRDKPDSDQTVATISPELLRITEGMNEERIRLACKQTGIELQTRPGNRDALLAELSRRLEGK